MDATNVATIVTDVQVIGDAILAEVGTLIPGLEAPTATAQRILDLLAQLASKAIAAWGEASDMPITAEAITALLPNQELLTPPTE